MDNIFIADEGKNLDRRLVVLSSVVVKNDSLRADIEAALHELIQSSDSGKGFRLRLLHPEEISTKNLQEYVTVFDQLFNYLKYLSSQRDAKILVKIAHAEHFHYDESVLKGLLPQEALFPQRRRLEQMMTSTFFEYVVSSLREFPIEDGDCIGSIYCDTALDLVNRSGNVTETLRSIFRPKVEMGHMVSSLVEGVHNGIGRTKHEGLKAVHFIGAEQSQILQVCRVMSHLLLSSIRYLVHPEDSDNARTKHLLMQNYFGLDKVPVESLKLEWNSTTNDVEPRKVASVAMEL
jgi:hypothetical protein